MWTVKSMAAIMRRQLDDGRALIVYGLDCAHAWQCEEFTSIFGDSSLHHARFRWCNIITWSQATQFKSIRSVTRVVSSMSLWAGPLGAEHWCTCHRSQHVSAKYIIDGGSNAKLRNQCWAEVAYYLIKLAGSGRPLTPHTRRWGARPELHLRSSEEMRSTEPGFAQTLSRAKDGRNEDSNAFPVLRCDSEKYSTVQCSHKRVVGAFSLPNVSNGREIAVRSENVGGIAPRRFQ